MAQVAVHYQHRLDLRDRQRPARGREMGCFELQKWLLSTPPLPLQCFLEPQSSMWHSPCFPGCSSQQMASTSPVLVRNAESPSHCGPEESKSASERAPRDSCAHYVCEALGCTCSAVFPTAFKANSARKSVKTCKSLWESHRLRQEHLLQRCSTDLHNFPCWCNI